MRISATTVLTAATLMGVTSSPVEAQRVAIDHGNQRQAAAPFDLLVPIHRNSFLPSQIWGGGLTYKVRFDGRFEFFPALGASYRRNLPLAWTTMSVRVGGAELAVERAIERTVGSDRYEYDRGGVVEAYDLSIEGVEQTFRIDRAPNRGTLIVEGKVDTSLTAPTTEHQHAAVRFCDSDGRQIIEYGAATAIDAVGKEFPMTTRYRSGRLELRLEASSVASAVFPLLVDPVVLNLNLTQGVGRIANATRDVRGQISLGRANFCAFTRVFSASDHDVQAVLAGVNFSTPVLVFADLSNAWSNEQIDVVSQPAANRYVIAMEQRQGFRTYMGFYAHGASSALFGSGTSHQEPTANGEHWRNPSVGATLTDDLILVMCDHTRGGTGVTSVRGLLWDSDGGPTAETQAAEITSGEIFPAISSHADPNWLLAWTHSSGGMNNLTVREITTQIIMPPVAYALVNSTNRRYSRPKIAGGSGRYYVSYISSPVGIGFNQLRGHRFDWDGSRTTIDDHLIHGGQTYQNYGLAYDSATRSHWGALYTTTLGSLRTLRIDRMGHAGVRTGTHTVETGTQFNRLPGSISFGDHYQDGPGFTHCWAPGGTNNPVEADRFGYPPVTLAPQRYGSGCSATTDAEVWSPSIAGSLYFRGTVENNPNALAACFIGQLSSAVPLDSIGMLGCTLLVEPALAASVPARYDGSNRPFVEISLPNDPLFTGTVHTQWAIVQPGTNALGVVTNAGRAHTVL